MTDDDLRARLRRTDPAASLGPATPDRIAQLTGETMTTTAVPLRRPLGRRRLVLAAAAVLALAAAGTGWVLTRTPAVPAPMPYATSVVHLTMTGARAKCAEPAADRLASAADFAFAGTVTGIAGEVVTLRVSHDYRGVPADLVEVAQQGDSSEQLLGGSGKFQAGRDYLVASAGGDVLICGYSGEAGTPGLRELYERAFIGR